MGGPRCVKHRGAHLFRLGGGFAPPLAKDVWISPAQFQDPSRLASARLSLDMIFMCRRCRSAGCLATIDPRPTP